MKTIKLGVSLSFAAISAVIVAVAFFGVKYADARLSSNAKNLASLIAVDNITGSSNGSLTNNNTNDLSELIVLGGLFPTSTNPTQNARDLAGLIAVNNVTGGSSGAFASNQTDLGSLIVLNGLFGGTGSSASTNAKNLAGLIAVSNITGGDMSGGNDNLGELLVLNGLFLDP
ncbi:MAG: hypothetical protein WC536_04115 [Patescibacteria group bacterium]